VQQVEKTPRSWFTGIKDSTQEDWDIIMAEDALFRAELPQRVLRHLAELDDQFSSFHLSRLGHSIQTATRAARAGRDDEYVACALLHDIGDTIGSYNHADIAAAVVKPFVRPEYHWMVEQHAVFQGYYFFHFVGGDRDERERFRGHPNFDLTAEFCEEFDGPAFDPNYPMMALEEFEPLIADLFARPRN
jgi:predicted HD phosphohydrolase